MALAVISAAPKPRATGGGACALSRFTESEDDGTALAFVFPHFSSRLAKPQGLKML
jgi:hypothetical protein